MVAVYKVPWLFVRQTQDAIPIYPCLAMNHGIIR